MRLSRRNVLKLGAVLAAAMGSGTLGWWWLRGRSVPQWNARQAAFLRAYVDVLVPADGSGPGALDLGIDRELLAASRTRPALRLLLARGAVPMERSAARQGQVFARLPVAARVELVGAAERAEAGSPQRRLFERLRGETMRRYYARAEAWAALCYAGPPQPRGFPEYGEAPRRCT